MTISNSNTPLNAADFGNMDFIGIKAFNHKNFGPVVLLESRSFSPKRFVIVIENKKPIYFSSYIDAINEYFKIKNSI